MSLYPDYLKRESLKTSIRESPLRNTTKENVKPPPPPRSAERSKRTESQGVQMCLLDRLDLYCSEQYPNDSMLLRLNFRLRDSVSEMVKEHGRLQKSLKIANEKEEVHSVRVSSLNTSRNAIVKLANRHLGKKKAVDSSDISKLCLRLGKYMKMLEDSNKSLRSNHDRCLETSMKKIRKLEDELSQKKVDEKSLLSHQQETRAQLHAYEFEVSKLQQRLNNTTETVSSQTYRIERLSEDEREARVKCSVLQNQVNQLQESVHSEREINNRINHEIDLHVCKNKALQEKHVALSNQVEKERIKLRDAEARLERAQEQLQTSDANLTEMRLYSAHLETRIDMLEASLQSNRKDFDVKLAEKTSECDKLKDRLNSIVAQYQKDKGVSVQSNLKAMEHLAKRTEMKFKRMSEQESVLQDEILRLARQRRLRSESPVEFRVRINWEAACARFGRIQVERFLHAISISLTDHWLSALVMVNDVYSPILPYFESERLNRCTDCLATFGFFSRKHNCMMCGKIICGTCRHRERLLQKNVTCKPCRDLVRMISFTCESSIVRN